MRSRQIHTISNLSKDQADLYYVKGWRSDSDIVPIYHASSPHAFNRAMGYARYKNSAVGTVLYRDQNKLYPSLLQVEHEVGKQQYPIKYLKMYATILNYQSFWD